MKFSSPSKVRTLSLYVLFEPRISLDSRPSTLRTWLIALHLGPHLFRQDRGAKRVGEKTATRYRLFDAKVAQDLPKLGLH